MNIFLLGTNHKTADIEFREKLAIEPHRLPAALDSLKERDELNECLILSTCNRTEIYGIGTSPSQMDKSILDFLSRQFGLSLEKKQNYFYRMKEVDAVLHLFRVAAGLDSMVLGEPQILGQLKDAFQIAGEQGATGVILNRLLHHSFTAGKRVRSETALGAGAVSVAYAAVELAQKIFRDLSKHRVLLLGAGETGELTAKHLREKGIGKIYISNRTPEKAAKIAAALDSEAVEFSRIAEQIPQVDILIGATHAPHYLIDSPTIQKMVSARGTNPLFMIDMGVPRNFDPTINRLESVFLHNIDDLQQIVDRNLEKRRLEIPKAENILSQEVESFLEWKKSLQVTPTVVSLRKRFEELRQKELKKYRNKTTESEYKKMDMISRAVLNKVLHAPMVELRKYGNGHPDGFLRVNVVRELFGLEDEE